MFWFRNSRNSNKPLIIGFLVRTCFVCFVYVSHVLRSAKEILVIDQQNKAKQSKRKWKELKMIGNCHCIDCDCLIWHIDRPRALLFQQFGNFEFQFSLPKCDVRFESKIFWIFLHLLLLASLEFTLSMPNHCGPQLSHYRYSYFWVKAPECLILHKLKLPLQFRTIWH
jgi:hypothetical protein